MRESMTASSHQAAVGLQVLVDTALKFSAQLNILICYRKSFVDIIPM